MTLRDATADDAAAIVEIWNRVIAETTITFTTDRKTVAGLAQSIAARQAAGDAFLVADEGGRITGFASFGPFRAGPGYAKVREHSVILAPRARGRGLGRALMAALEDRARIAGLHVLVGGVSGDNPGAIAFHKAVGYTETGRLPEVGRKFDRWLDLVFLQKIL